MRFLGGLRSALIRPAPLRRVLPWPFRLLLPWIALALEVLPALELNRRFLYEDLGQGPWVWLLLFPFLGVELTATAVFEWPTCATREETRTQAIALAARLGFVSLYFWLLVVRASEQANTSDIFASLMVRWPYVFLMSLRSSPLLSVLLMGSATAAFLILTVRRCRWRLTTTVIIPGGLAILIFQLFYFFPTSPLRLEFHEHAPEAELVFPYAGMTDPTSCHGSTTFPRDLYVLPDEQRIVATYGRTFQLLGFLHVPTPSLLQIDLAARTCRSTTTSVIRRFQSDCSERLFMSPWHGSLLLEVETATRNVSQHRLPARAQGARVEEVNFVLHSCELNRVFVGNSRNPVVFVWNTRTASVENELDLAGVNGIRMGDSLGFLVRNPALKKIYIGLFGTWHIVELDEATLKPSRFLRMEHDIWDLSISPDGSFMYVAGWFKGRIWKVDARSLEVAARFEVPLHCRRVAPTPDGRMLLVASYLTGELLALDARTGQVVRRLFVGPKPEGLFVSAHFVWVSSSIGILKVPLSSIGCGSAATEARAFRPLAHGPHPGGMVR